MKGKGKNGIAEMERILKVLVNCNHIILYSHP